jgi:hypothetical protein
VFVDLDAYELRALHFASAFSREIFNSGELVPELPDGRSVSPLDSALMKLETALIASGGSM